jgi:hypothetical protein
MCRTATAAVSASVFFLAARSVPGALVSTTWLWCLYNLSFTFVCNALQVFGPIRLVATVFQRSYLLNAPHIFLRNRSLDRRALERAERGCRASVRIWFQVLGAGRLGLRTLRPGRRRLGAGRLGCVMWASLGRSCGFGCPGRLRRLAASLLVLLRHHFLLMGAGDRGDVCIVPAQAAKVIPKIGKGAGLTIRQSRNCS